jgi:hypothetical protein
LVINAPKVLNKQEAKKYPFYKNWLDLDNAWRGKIASDYSVKELTKILIRVFVNLFVFFINHFDSPNFYLLIFCG